MWWAFGLGNEKHNLNKSKEEVPNENKGSL
jgi:hypothetical protein